MRSNHKGTGFEAMVQEYSLSSQEGIALMCLAESLLRIPDDATRDALIRDKIAPGNWASHLGIGRSLFVNAATWGLAISGKLVSSVNDSGLGAALGRLIARAGEPVVRRAVDLAMRMMGEQFVTGETIEKALARTSTREADGFLYSFDMLGEAAATAQDAARYYAAYENAIHAIGKAAMGRGIYAGNGISTKLSALHPRYVRARADRVMSELVPRIKALARLAKSYDIGLNIDAEEADRLELSLDVLEELASDADLAGWDGLGFVVQAYGQRCPFVIDWLIDLARRTQRRIMVRLVKGAYWDSEIKRAQVDGLADFPVYTRKLHTDVAYIACAAKLLAAKADIYPQFATHNAQTLATIYHMAGAGFRPGDFEFQCLHGMGEALYEEVVGFEKLNRPCRIYAPVGTHETLLPYLVRRLLENGANSSFVNQIGDQAVSIEQLIADPAQAVAAMARPGASHPMIALPPALYPDRRNSQGFDLTDETALVQIGDALAQSAATQWHAAMPGASGTARSILNPADRHELIGTVIDASPQEAADAASRAASASWSATPVDQRAAALERAADIMQARMPALMALLIREAGKTAANALSEVREAIDFLRYYAEQARNTLGTDATPLGPVVCISPWNFPLAIFTGQVSAALAAGNPVLAKPAEETPLIAAQAVDIFHEAGVPHDALQLVPGDGEIGAALVGAPQTAGVVFTGSTQVARLIQRQLAERPVDDGKPIPLIAETGGINAMIVDSSALPEQVTADVLASAFDSAGQRCSALRILCVQEDVADHILDMLKQASAELRCGNPAQLASDIGPVISADAKMAIEQHIADMRAQGRRVTQAALADATEHGTFVAPTIIELDDVAELDREIFGPVLHIVRFARDELDAVIDAINASGYGLSFGLHTRLDETMAHVTARVRAGNHYINRNMIGAVVGVQPFGGRGFSGTGPKAGGPLYVGRLVRNMPAPPASPADMPEALGSFAAWLDQQGERIAAATARAYGELSPLGTVERLPGPVGEENLYALHPRGTMLLAPSTIAGLYQQMSAILATGNDGLIMGMPLPADLPEDVAARFPTASAGQVTAVLIEGAPERTSDILREIANRPGPTPLIQAASPADCANGPAYRLEWLVQEISTSTNTTACGGNASLMALT